MIPLENCPRCSNKLGAPLKSGRQVCMKCGWSDHPKHGQMPNHDTHPIPTPSPWGSSGDDSVRKVLSILVHASLFFSSTGASLILPVVLLIASKDQVVKHNAREVLNLQITLFLYAIAFFGLLILIQGPAVVLFFVILVISFLCPILALIHCIQYPNIPYTYPFIMHILTA